MNGEGEFFAEHFGEIAGFFGGSAVGAAEAEWESDDDFADFVVIEDLAEGGEVGAFVFAEERGKALRGDAEGVGDSETDAAGAEVDSEDSGMNRGRFFHCGHGKIIVASTATVSSFRTLGCAMWREIGMPELLFLVGFFIIGLVTCVIPFWQIFKKAGFTPWLSLLMAVPLVNFVSLYFLAFAPWPAGRRSQQ